MLYDKIVKRINLEFSLQEKNFFFYSLMLYLFEMVAAHQGFPSAQMVKNPPVMQETWISQENPLKKGTATDSRILAWRIPWSGEEPGGLQSMSSQSDTTE